MDVSVSSLAQSSATSSSSSVLPSDSASQFASTLSEPEASSTEHTVKRRKLRAIATWDHFRGAQGDEPRAISGNLLHYCKRCRNPSWSTHISSNARYHLKKAHHIFVREDSSSQNKRQLAIENAFARTTARQLQQVREHERNTLRSVINVDAFREAQMLLSAHRHLPLNFVTWPEYQALLTAVNPAVQEFLTDSGNTVAADLDRAYDAHQQSVKKWLEHARSLVHIAMDVWSSPQRKAYVAVHAQWVDEAYKPRKALLGLPNLRRSHAGAAMTPHLMEIIRKYHLAPRIGYFTGDNDAKNDTCLRQLAVGLSQEYGLTFDPVSSRTRCAGHIINLSLQAFLFATSEDALQAAIEQAQDEANDVTVSDALHDRIQSNTCQKSHGRRNKRNDTAGWRSIGPMDNIAVFIRNSTVRNDAWDDIAGKALGIDNITRWNSWFKLLDAAISQEGPLSIFLNQYHEELEDDILTHDDWQVLKMAHEFLQPFYQATLEQQMEWASIDQVLENMDILFLQFENAKKNAGGHTDIPGNDQADKLAKAGSSAPEPEGAQPTLAYLRRIARQKPKEAFETWWSTSAPEQYKRLNLKATTCCPPELTLPRAALHHLLAARSLHGDFAAYHERFNHSDAHLSQYKELVQYIDEKKLKPAFDDTVFELADAKDAYRKLKEQKHFAKVVIRMDHDEI
ncbi:hypothetical protein HZS61_010582 [Fusarium oxysporum f. sp. conglutinans]|uniref:Transposase-like protein n=1 Tax=Fusarium oxysporum f. sp. conglutinans TaxID=100902 RepID=A0A8H6GU02_FUSOX|nr:hypothetical protein HZS61_010582 [Fusarium oxysporum f. sp. conglutinans]